MRDSWRAAFFLFVVLNVAFFPLFWSKKTILLSATQPSILPIGPLGSGTLGISYPTTPDPGAPAWTIEAYLKLIKHQYFTEHVVPLWNPYQAYGAPFAANMQSQPFYPLTVLLALHSSPKTYNWYILLRLFLAGFSMYLYLRYFVSFHSALVGGIATMLGGYYVLYCEMPEISVAISLPMGLLAAEYLVRKQSYLALVLFALNVALLLAGGMPEEAFIGFTLIYPYALLRIWQARDGWLRQIQMLAVSSIAGVLLSAALLLPFWEFVQNSFNIHDTRVNGGAIVGSQHDRLGGSILTYFFPLLFGPPTAPSFGPAFSGLRNYWGLVGFFLMLVSWFSLRRKQALSALTVFFSAVLLFFVFKRYGVQPFNLVGSLPLYNMIVFYKYGESAVSICVAVLCAIGCERLIRKQIAIGPQTASILLSAVPIFCAAAYHVRSGLINRVFMRFSAVAIAVPLLLLFLLAVVLIWTNRTEAALRSWHKFAIAGLVALEFSFIFAFPMFRVFNNLADRDKDPFRGAPYLNLLQSLTARQHERVFGRYGSLYPNWSSAFEIADIRALDALYYRKYLPFIRNFASAHVDYQGDLGERFTGVAGFAFDDPLALRLFQLSSVKYLITSTPPHGVANPRIAEAMKQNEGHLAPGGADRVQHLDLAIANDARDAFLEHPPYTRLPYRLAVPNDAQPSFLFSYGMSPGVFDKAGDGVTFAIEVRDQSGNTAKLFSHYINPKTNAAERRWMDGAVDLTSYRGQTVDLLFSTDAGPAGDSTFDWAYWSNFHFQSEAVKPAYEAMKLVYHGETFVYRYENVLPRAAVFYRTVTVANEQEALTWLARPDSDVFGSAVVTAKEKAHSDEINKNPPRPAAAAAITSYKSQDVSISASLPQAGILTLNDSDYPGWVVDVDGKRGEWFTVNYMFRGVFLQAGKHTVRFRYQPKSFAAGASVSVGTFALLMGIGVFRKISARRRQRN